MSDTAGGEIVSAAIAQNMATDYLRGDPSADLSKLKFKPSLVRPGKPVSDGGGLTSQEVGEIGKSYGASLGETAAVMAIASESSGRGLFGPEGVGIAYTIANRMRKRDKGAWDTVVGDADTTGEQRGRPYSTRRVPGASKFPRILEMFRRAVDKPGEDPTGGATMFFHPTAQKSLHYRDPKRFKSPEEVRKTREGAGLERVNVPGADNIEFHR